MQEVDDEEPEAAGVSTRRAFLSVAGSGLAAGLAGCSGTSQTFEANEVLLPADAQSELALGETRRETQTLSRTGPTGSVDVTIVSHTAVYSRAAGLGGE